MPNQSKQKVIIVFLKQNVATFPPAFALRYRILAVYHDGVPLGFNKSYS